MQHEVSPAGSSPTHSEPRRSGSWKQEEIILFNEANDNLSLVRRDQINCEPCPLNFPLPGGVPLTCN